jgi:4-carboxymuconolactone decarboxylase
MDMKTFAIAISLVAVVVTVSGRRNATGATPAATPAGEVAGAVVQITRAGSRLSVPGPAERFTGSVRIQPLFDPHEPSRASGGSVTFEPGARSAWHTHPLGQTLIVTAGVGRIQRWGGPIEEIRQGDVVWIPPGQKHWHGAGSGTAMTHTAIQESVGGRNVDWLEKVSDAQYAGTPVGTSNRTDSDRAASVQRSFGDFAPKLAELTNEVLFKDVWERPQLSKRDRSLITCAALISLGKTEQMGFHFPYAIENGVTQQELGEAITHLAFYVGWPNALSAIARAKEVLGKKQP